MKEFKSILYPVALTEISPKVAPYVVTMTRQLGAQVHLLHVLRRFDWFVDDMLYRGATSRLEEVFRSRFRFLHAYSTLWLGHQDQGGITPL